MTIWKYPLTVRSGKQDLMVPAGATLLHVEVQQGSPTLWFLINTTNGILIRTFRVYGTGHEIDRNELEAMSHIGTSTDLGSLVWHVFEIVPAPQARSVQ
jgi:hypothetical protein